MAVRLGQLRKRLAFDQDLQGLLGFVLQAAELAEATAKLKQGRWDERT